METDVLKKFERAGKIASEVRTYAQKLLREDALILELARSVEKKIFELGARPAFPVNISINEVAAHYTPRYNDTTILKTGDLVKFDFGVHVDGAPADTAFSVSIGKDETNESIIAASRAALDAAIAIVKPGLQVSEIGSAVDAAAKKHGMQVIRNLSGHGIDIYDLHSEPSIPNFDNKDDTKLEENTIIAIEPFATTGKGFVTEAESCEIYKIVKFAPIRDREVMEFIAKEYNMLPFAKRWIVDKFGPLKASLALREAVSRGILYEYKVLKEVSGAKVAQTEHTILISKNSRVLTAQKD